MDRESLLALIRRRVEEAGNQKLFAAAHGLSTSYVSDVLKGRREPAGKLLSAVGVRRVVTFEPVAGAGASANPRISEDYQTRV